MLNGKTAGDLFKIHIYLSIGENCRKTVAIEL